MICRVCQMCYLYFLQLNAYTKKYLAFIKFQTFIDLIFNEQFLKAIFSCGFYNLLSLGLKVTIFVFELLLVLFIFNVITDNYWFISDIFLFLPTQ